MKPGVRVVAGKYRGLKLSVPPGLDVRPTADKVKEALFSILGDRVFGAKVVDCFSGSGALGIEALSRGAEAVLFVESASVALNTLRENLDRLPGEHRGHLLVADAFRPQRWNLPSPADIVLADPPYKESAGDRFLAGLEPGVTVSPSGLVVIEHEREVTPADPQWYLQDSRQYGGTSLSFFASQARGQGI